jgi:predicted glycoside hydrolase/deacetylase ChbG (UPF0249 family)
LVSLEKEAMRRLFVLCLLLFQVSVQAQDSVALLIRCDDIGMSRSVNMAAKKVLETGLPISFSVMVPCPWFEDAVALLKQYPQASVGIHLTLNSEWKQYRWGPVSGKHMVPSLVDSMGNFFPSRAKLFANKPALHEIEFELRAQIEKAKKAGLPIAYLDYHMGAAMQTLETRQIVEKLAKEFGVSISRYYGEKDMPSMYAAAPETKKAQLLEQLNKLKPGSIQLLVTHVGIDNDELAAMEDLNPGAPAEMSKHRQAELNALLSPELRKLLQQKHFKLVNYTMLNQQIGINKMKRPE